MKLSWLGFVPALLFGLLECPNISLAQTHSLASMASTPYGSTTSEWPVNSGCSTGCCEDPFTPRSLFPETCGGWRFYGWLNGGITANADEPASRFNGPNTFNDREDVMFNQAYAVLERSANNCGDGWAWGGRADVLWGTDFVFTQTIGQELHSDLSDHWNQRRFYGLAVPQLYGEVAYDDLSVKVGHFYTPLGYETVQAVNNFFYSHSYTHRFAQPFTHTGALATYRWNEQFSVVAGIVNGADRLDGLIDRIGYVGGATLYDQDGAWSLAAFGFFADEPNSNGTTASWVNLYSVVFTYNFSDCLQYVLEHDLGNHQNFIGGTTAAQWYSVSNYLYYTLNDRVKAGFRAEWFRDDDGTRVQGIRAGNPAAGGYEGNFYNATAGLNIAATRNLMLRPELRFDWFDGTGLPYNDATKTNQLTAALDVTLRW